MLDTPSWYSSIELFISDSWDIILLLIVLGLAILIFKFLKYLTLPLIILSQLLMASFVTTAMLSFLAFMLTSLVAVYNRIFSLSDYISSYSSAPCFFHMLDCLAVTGILSSYFTELFALFIIILFIRTSFLFIWAMNFISDKIWKIGVLLGLV